MGGAMRYFVTGATGFIGGHVAARLSARGDEVVALVRSPEKQSLLRSLGVEVVAGDVTNRESLRTPMQGVDGVFHVAGWYKIGVKHRSTALAVNVEGTRNVLSVMRELRIRRGVYTSTLAVFSDTRGALRDESYRSPARWLTLYDESKWRAHYEVAEPMIREGLPLTIVLPGAVYGPGDTSPMHDVWVEYLSHKLRAVPKTTAFCFGHVDDTAEGHLLAMDKGKSGESYIIAGPPHTLVEAIAIGAQATGIPGPSSHPSRGLVRFLAALTRNERLRIAAATYLGSNAKAQRELGFSPRPLDVGLPPTLKEELESRAERAVAG